jgi:EamA-like transporter family
VEGHCFCGGDDGVELFRLGAQPIGAPGQAEDAVHGGPQGGRCGAGVDAGGDGAVGDAVAQGCGEFGVLLGTGVAYVLNYQIITSEGATIASTVTYLLPVVAIVLGVLVLGETVTAMMLAGIALVLAGVALTRRHTRAATH